jgi:low affinity Fe/Cu permease
MHELFRKFSAHISHAAGSAWAFFVAVGAIVIWAALGPIYHYSDTWQLVINTGTTIVTFLMVFLIQNTQNRDAKATHLKLDELIKGVRGARNMMVDVEEMSDKEMATLEHEFKQLRARFDAHAKRHDTTEPRPADRSEQHRSSHDGEE